MQGHALAFGIDRLCQRLDALLEPHRVDRALVEDAELAVAELARRLGAGGERAEIALDGIGETLADLLGQALLQRLQLLDGDEGELAVLEALRQHLLTRPRGEALARKDRLALARGLAADRQRQRQEQRAALVGQPAAAEHDRLLLVLARQMEHDGREAAAAVERGDERRGERPVGRRQQIEEGGADEVFRIAAVELLGRSGDERDCPVDRHLDHEVGGGEGEADEAVALAADGAQDGICGVQSHTGGR